MIFREALPGDIPGLAELHIALVYEVKSEAHDEYWDFDTLSVADTEDMLRSYIGHTERCIFVCGDKDIITGFICAEITECHMPLSSVKSVGYISAAYVLPEYRNRGVMKRLEALASNLFKQRGLKYAELNFLSGNAAAKKAWQALGYNTFREQARKKLE